MKRSEINSIIKQAEEFMSAHQFYLPPWAYWEKEEWLQMKERCSSIFETKLGWDITDFGSENFYKRGLVLVTLRNGVLEKGDKTYAEKIMVVRENQETPYHFHWQKAEDIINRGGGKLCFQLYNSGEDESLLQTTVRLLQDGIEREYRAGETVVLNPGESMTLPAGVYHRFYAQAGGGPVLAGEVSMVNDDAADNRFYDAPGRFPAIDEDEKPYRYLVSDYAALLDGSL